jgi:hypothetical protein
MIVKVRRQFYGRIKELPGCRETKIENGRRLWLDVRGLKILFRRVGYKGAGDWKVDVHCAMGSKYRICAGWWCKDSDLQLEGVRIYSGTAVMDRRPLLIVSRDLASKESQRVPLDARQFVQVAADLSAKLKHIVKVLTRGAR